MSTSPHTSSPQVPTPHLVIIDGMSFLFRAYYAVRNLTRSDGQPTNALFGFSQMLIRVVKDLQPTFCAVALDSQTPTFRKVLYPDYKAHRQEPDEDLKRQFPFFEPLIAAFGIPALRLNGVEADDIIATLAKHFTAQNHGAKVTIVSSDKDLMQLLGGTITMLDTMKNKTFSIPDVAEKFGITPAQVPDVQALIGDSSDNIPGVPGIGPKTAAELINRFGSLENLYDQLESIEREKLRENLSVHKANAFLSKELATLKTDVPLPENLDETLSFHPNLSGAIGFLEELEFTTLAERLRKDGQKQEAGKGRGEAREGQGARAETASTPTKPAASAAKEAAPHTQTPLPPLPLLLQSAQEENLVSHGRAVYETVTTPERLQAWLTACREAKSFAIDTETTSLNPLAAKLVGISLAVEEGSGCYIPVGHTAPQAATGDLFAEPSPLGGHAAHADAKHAARSAQLPKAKVLEALKPLLEDPAVAKIGQNIKYDYLIFQNEGVTLQNLEDTMVISYCLDAGRTTSHGMDALAKEHLDHTCIAYKDVCGTGQKQISFADVPLPAATAYAAEDADVTLRLFNVLNTRLHAPQNEPLLHLYNTVEKPLIPVLAAMERRGVLVNANRLTELSADFLKRLKELEESIKATANTEINPNSPSQLAVLLFDTLGLSTGKKAQDDKRSTSAGILEILAERYAETPHAALISCLQEYRTLAKLRSTYAEALLKQINPQTGRVHTSYNQTGAATGRLSSSDPNLQNIPIRTEEGRKIRRAFIVPEGCVMLCADYSQIELRLLAHFSGSEALRQAFQEGIDIHTHTASQIFNTSPEEVSKNQRRAAKLINFGLVYGMGATSLAAQIGVSKKEAEEYIANYFARYEGVKPYLERTTAFAKQHGYVETLMGRRVHLPEINGKNGGLRAGAERAAINAPLQGSNADIIKKVMPTIEEALEEAGLKTKMLMQVHDELVFEAPKAEQHQATDLIRRHMEQAVTLSVPLVVDVGCGGNWEDAH